ncbi:unnamed protein product [Closterium sp. NIES-65]|nr:unnamed protein product [Closterium sp. NIES-65]
MAPGVIDYSQLPSDLDPSRLPRHVAIILDGNSRWATRKGMPKMMGHDAGVKSNREIVRLCGEWGIRALTVFAFSTENWGRPKEEVDFLMELLGTFLESELDELHRQRVVVRVIGDTSRLSPELQDKIESAHVRTQDNDGLRYSIATANATVGWVQQHTAARFDKANPPGVTLSTVKSGVEETGKVRDREEGDDVLLPARQAERKDAVPFRPSLEFANMTPLSTSTSAVRGPSDFPHLTSSGVSSTADGALSEPVLELNDALHSVFASGFVRSARSSKPEAPEALLPAMPYLPPRDSAASAGVQPRNSAAKASPATTTDCSPSTPPTSKSASGPNEIDYSQLPSDLDPSRLPRHVAIILDGNSRWATRKGMPRMMGHLGGVDSLSDAVRRCSDWGIRALTVFAFSTENWNRPEAEVNFLMAMMSRVLVEKLDELHSQGAVVRFLGNISDLDPELQHRIKVLQDTTRDNRGLQFSVSLNYSGRQDIVHACQRIAERVAAGELQPAQISESLVSKELSTSWLGLDLANPDLLIRTSGELRLSNFLLWQSAYTELHFCDTLWPDFGAPQLHAALLEYQRRDRRFGRRKESG